jgi:hypothetical protein
LVTERTQPGYADERTWPPRASPGTGGVRTEVAASGFAHRRCTPGRESRLGHPFAFWTFAHGLRTNRDRPETTSDHPFCFALAPAVGSEGLSPGVGRQGCRRNADSSRGVRESRLLRRASASRGSSEVFPRICATKSLLCDPYLHNGCRSNRGSFRFLRDFKTAWLTRSVREGKKMVGGEGSAFRPPPHFWPGLVPYLFPQNSG